jgi:hypothetical protein
VRGCVLQQRGLPPALGRLPVPLLPVQALALLKQSFGVGGDQGRR